MFGGPTFTEKKLYGIAHLKLIKKSSRARNLKNPRSISNGNRKNDSPFFDLERTIGVVSISINQSIDQSINLYIHGQFTF